MENRVYDKSDVGIFCVENLLLQFSNGQGKQSSVFYNRLKKLASVAKAGILLAENQILQ